MLRVLCQDCGHREAMPSEVVRLAVKSRQDPKCPSCQSANLTVDAARRHASEPDDPEMLYGPESGYWDAREEAAREEYEMKIRDEDDEVRGWEFSDEKDSAYGEYVRDFLGDDSELEKREAHRQGRRRKVASLPVDPGARIVPAEVSRSFIEPGEVYEVTVYDPNYGVGGFTVLHRGNLKGGPGLEIYDTFLRLGADVLSENTSESGEGTYTLALFTQRTGSRKVAYGSGAPRVWIASLSDYNNGKLVGKWVDATSIESLEEGAREVLAMSSDPFAEELAIHDYDNFGNLASTLGEYPNWETVAAFGALIEEHGDVALAAIDTGHSDDPDDIANLIDDGYQGQFSSDRDFAMELVDDIGLESFSNPGAYFDYASWGSDTSMELSWSGDPEDPDPLLESLRNDYQGDYGAWAEELIDDLGGINQLEEGEIESYIDWDSLTYDLMMDYMESRGHYFRAI